MKNIGTVSADDARHVSADVTRVLTEAFGVREDRIYIEFTDATGYLWGHAGDTLA